jgi:hypothetical protein
VVLHHGSARPGLFGGRSDLEVANIFRLYGTDYRRTHPITAEQLRVMRDIETCRTAVHGGHVDECPCCGLEVPAYNSCGNRHCPKCQALAQAIWIEQRKKRVLPVNHFHLVFTLPAQLRSLALCNRKVVYDLLFATASSTLLTLGHDPERLNGTLGITAILHTWTRELAFHPHLHCVVTGGALDAQNQWKSCSRRFLFPVKVLSKLFRSVFLHALERARSQGLLEFAGACASLADDSIFAQLRDALYHKKWVVYAKRPFDNSNYVFDYLGRYTHRVAISNQRLIRMDDEGITFATKNGKTKTLHPQEFIRRFLLSVLPDNFVKIRHYGLYASSSVNTTLARAHAQFQPKPEPLVQKPAAEPARDAHGMMLKLTGKDIHRCPRCGHGRMNRTAVTPGDPFLWDLAFWNSS